MLTLCVVIFVEWSFVFFKDKYNIIGIITWNKEMIEDFECEEFCLHNETAW